MTPKFVIDNVVNMSLWQDTVWINHSKKLFFVPIWRNGNTEFMYAADKFGFKLEILDNVDYIGFAFIRNPNLRIAGQIWRAMQNQGLSFNQCIENLNTDLDPHFRTQHSFVEKYNIEYYLDLDNLQLTDNADINQIIYHMQQISDPRSKYKNKSKLESRLIYHSYLIKTIYKFDFLLYNKL